jgi:hypothetical protein
MNNTFEKLIRICQIGQIGQTPNVDDLDFSNINIKQENNKLIKTICTYNHFHLLPWFFKLGRQLKTPFDLNSIINEIFEMKNLDPIEIDTVFRYVNEYNEELAIMESNELNLMNNVDVANESNEPIENFSFEQNEPSESIDTFSCEPNESVNFSCEESLVNEQTIKIDDQNESNNVNETFNQDEPINDLSVIIKWISENNCDFTNVHEMAIKKNRFDIIKYLKDNNYFSESNL